jgi:hypothetical protein
MSGMFGDRSLANGSRYAVVAREMAPLSATPEMFKTNRLVSSFSLLYYFFKFFIMDHSVPV